MHDVLHLSFNGGKEPGTAEIANLISGPDLEEEFLRLRDESGSTPTMTSLRAFAVICAVAVARVKVLERELSAVGHRPSDAGRDKTPGHA